MSDLTKFVIVNIGLASGEPDPAIGQWLVHCDVDAFNGRGFAKWTSHIDEAMRFDNAGFAQAYWIRQSKVKPLREDGQPNRPLTAYTVNIVKVLA